jgi:hypothetical protein
LVRSAESGRAGTLRFGVLFLFASLQLTGIHC